MGIVMKKRSVSALFALMAGLSFASAAPAADWQRGQQLHDSQCVACHASRFSDNGAAIYTRANRRVGSLDALQRQVDRCKNNLQITWFDDDVADVVAYLNRNFYKFEK